MSKKCQVSRVHLCVNGREGHALHAYEETGPNVFADDLGAFAQLKELQARLAAAEAVVKAARAMFVRVNPQTMETETDANSYADRRSFLATTQASQLREALAAYDAAPPPRAEAIPEPPDCLEPNCPMCSPGDNEKKNDWEPMVPPQYDQYWREHDMRIGPCSCGATHTKDCPAPVVPRAEGEKGRGE